jgi:predicted nucleic acid-binding protein
VTLVDTNVLVDILSADSAWLDWSQRALEARSVLGALVINEVVYAEMSGHMQSEPALKEALNAMVVELHRTPTEALFLAGKAFRRYRETGGLRTGVLPDFFIGAHALVSGMPLLTRDLRRYHTYFPEVTLITPKH